MDKNIAGIDEEGEAASRVLEELDSDGNRFIQLDSDSSEEDPWQEPAVIEWLVKEPLDKVVEGKSDFESLFNISQELFNRILWCRDYRHLKVDYSAALQCLEARLPSVFAGVPMRAMTKASQKIGNNMPKPECYKATAPLLDGTRKSPDCGVYDPKLDYEESDISQSEAALRIAIPTMVWEVAETEHAKRLGRDCAHWLIGGEDYVTLAIGIEVSYGTPPGASNTALKMLHKIGISEWRFVGHTDPDIVEEKDCYKLRRSDGLDDDSAPSLSDSYKFSHFRKKKGTAETWVVARNYKEIYGPNITQPVQGEICLRVMNVLRDAPEGLTDMDAYVTVPYHSIVEACEIFSYLQRAADSGPPPWM